MKKLYVLVFLISAAVSAQTNEKTCELLTKIDALMRREHFNPRPIDDSLSVFVFDGFVDLLDEDRNLFTKAEYETLCKHRLTLDDDILKHDCSFMDDFVDLYRKALERKKAIIEKLQQNPLDYSGKDSLRFSKDGFPFDLADKDFENVWRKRLAFEVLEDISKSGNSLDSIRRNFTEMEKSASSKVFQNNLCRVNNTLEPTGGFSQRMQNDFLNAFCMAFDPHSNYFFLDEKMSFMSSLSTSNLSLGMELGMNEKEEIVVQEIIPGGPAAQSKKIEKEDIIVKVSDKAGREYLVSCTSMDLIGDIIFSDANTEIKFTIKKKNGTLLDLVLNKEVMKATENSVYSFIAEKKARVGYIRIPSFYSDFEGNSSHGCAEDVAKEIAKLRKDNIDGIILDLQDNGGGSMDEAIKLAGMFIDNGPVSVSVNKNGKQTVMRDTQRGMIYNGPIVVMINGQSASASEFFAGAMQDYNRALIAGATSLGKASIQVIQPIDMNQEEFVKVTIQKFYRITGESSQIKGIVPDIYFPTVYDSIIPREKSYKNALPYDFIKTDARFKRYEQDFSPVIARSIERVKSNPRFIDLADIDKKVSEVYNNPVPSLALSLDDVFNMLNEIDVLWKRIKAQAAKPSGCKISNNSNESRRIRHDRLLQEINADKMAEVRSNPYVEEAVNIVRDCKTLVGD